VLQIAWMSPHKPDPNARKVEVDLSEILIRPEALERLGPGSSAKSSNALPVQWKDSLTNENPRIGSVGWTNIVFAIGSGLVGVFCTLSVFENFEHDRRLAHPPAYAIYARPELGAATPQHFTLQTLRAPTTAKLGESKVNSLDEKTISQNQSPMSSISSPLRESTNSPLLQNSGRATNNASNNISGPAHSTGAPSMPEESASTARSGNDTSRSEQSRARNIRRHAQRLISSSSRQTRRQTGSALKIDHHTEQQRVGAMQTASARNAPGNFKQSMGSNVASMQSGAGLNCMHMQHGIIAQPVLGSGLGGLNSGGLGGGGNRVGHGRR
jgi:hypothetical protein